MQQGSKAELRIQDALLMNRTSDCWLIRIFLFQKDCRVQSWYLAQYPADGFVPEWGIPADLGVSWCIQFYPKKLRRCFHFQPVFFVTLRLEDIEQHVRNREEKERRILFDRQSATAAKSLRRGMFFFQWPACCLVPLFLRGWWQQDGRNAWTNGHQLCPNIGHLTSCAKNSNICVESRQY